MSGTGGITARPPSALPVRRTAPSLTADQRKQANERRLEKQAALDAEIAKFFDGANSLSIELSQRFGKKPEHYMNLLFSANKLATSQRKISAYNAWVHERAKEENKDSAPGQTSSLMELQEDGREAYHQLTQNEKDALVAQLEETRATRSKSVRVTARGRVQDVVGVCHQIETLLHGLKLRAGVEGFFCIVKNSTEYRMQPRWYFTHENINEYLRMQVRKGWDPEKIAGFMEAFAVAGCEFVSALKSTKAKADAIKKDVRARIQEKLATITGNPKALMQYTHYERDIVVGQGLELVGWTHPKFANPSELGTSLEPLRTLLDALRNDTCKFVKLSATDRAERKKEYERKLKAGEVKERKARSDKGKKRVLEGHGGSDADSEPDTGAPRKRARGAPISPELVPDNVSQD